MSMCVAALTDPADIKRCEKFGCRDRATCYHVYYYYCDTHCPMRSTREHPSRRAS